MKKVKRNNSLNHKCKLKCKTPNQPKTAANSKKNILAKKQVLQKENRSFFEEKLSLLSKKKTNTKSKEKQRSKSLLYCCAEASLPYQSTHRPALADYHKNKVEKEDTDISGNINSRYEKGEPFISNFHTPYPKQRHAFAFS